MRSFTQTTDFIKSWCAVNKFLEIFDKVIDYYIDDKWWCIDEL